MKNKIILSLIFVMMMMITLISATATDFTTNNEMFLPLANINISYTGLIDLSANNNDGSGFNGITFTNSSQDSFSFDGVGDYVKVSDDSSIDLSSSKTISFWLYQKEDSSSNYQRRIIGKPDRNNGISYHPNNNEIRIIDGTNQKTYSINRNEWIHILYTENSGTGYLYINGVLDSSFTMNLNWNNAEDIYIGGGDSNRYLTGLLSDVLIYSRVLNSSEISSLYDEGRNYNFYEDVSSSGPTPYLLANSHDFEDFSFKSSSYSRFSEFSINSTIDKDIMLSSVFNLKKTSGFGSNDVYVKVNINGVDVSEELVRTISGTSDNSGVVKYNQVFNISSGVNNFSFYIKRTGWGKINLFNSDTHIIDLDYSSEGVIDHFNKIINGSCSASSSWAVCGNISYDSSFNQDLLTYGSSRWSNGVDVYNMRFSTDNPVTSRTLSSGSVGAVSSSWVNTVTNSTGSFNIYQKSSAGSSFDIKGELILVGTKTNNTEIPHFNITGSSTESSPVNYGSGMKQVLSKKFNVTENNNGYYFSFDGHLKNNAGATGTATWSVYVDNNSCTHQVVRTYADNNIGSVGTSLYCSNLDLTEHTVYVNVSLEDSSDWSYYDDDLTGVEVQELDISEISESVDPVVNITFPSNNEWTALYINGTCTDDSVITDVVINNSLFELVSADYNNWSFKYIGANTLDSLNLSVSCTDVYNNTGSASVVTGVDNHKPVCTGISDQTIIYGNNYSWNVNCSDDSNLFSVNVSCSGGSGFNFFIDNINDVNYLMNNNTGNLLSAMVCDWTVKDAHTLQDVSKDINPVNTFYYDNAIVIDGFAYIEYDDSHSDDINMFELDFVSKKDRVKFKITPKETTTGITIKGSVTPINYKENTLTFYVNAKNDLEYINNKKYPAWFVIDGKYWADFDVINAKEKVDYRVQKINDKRYRVIVSGKVGDYFDFNSLGVVNTNTYSQTFSIEQPSLSFGLICGEKYVNKNVTANFSSNGLHDCSFRVNDLIYYVNGSCDSYTFTGFNGNNKMELSGLDSSDVLQSDVCHIYISSTDKELGDFFMPIIIAFVFGIFFLMSRRYILFTFLCGIAGIIMGFNLYAFSSILGLITIVGSLIYMIFDLMYS